MQVLPGTPMMLNRLISSKQTASLRSKYATSFNSLQNEV